MPFTVPWQEELTTSQQIPKSCVCSQPLTHTRTHVNHRLNADCVHVGWEKPLSRGQDLDVGHLHTAASLGQLGPPLSSIGMSSGPTAGR